MAQGKKSKTYKAFTLVEILVYVFVFSIVATTLTSIMILTYRYKIIIEDRVSVDEDLRILVKTIRDDLYLGSGVSVDGTGALIITDTTGDQIKYSLQGTQVFRQKNADLALAITGSATKVISFDVEDLTSAQAAGVVQITLDMSNFPSGFIKPEVRETVTSTMSIKFV